MDLIKNQDHLNQCRMYTLGRKPGAMWMNENATQTAVVMCEGCVEVIWRPIH